MSRPGGLSEPKPANEEVQEIADKVKSTFEEKSGRSHGQFKVVSYATQVVAGTNYFIKVCVGANDYVILRVFQGFDQELTLSSYQLDKKEDDPIEYFD